MPDTTVSTAPVSFIPAITAKLRTDLNLNTNQVRVVDEKTIRGKFTEVFQEKGIAICLSNAQPSPHIPGGGRNAYKVRRNLWIRPVTVSFNDPTGRNEYGLVAHWTFQDAILSSLVGSIVPPLILPLHLSSSAGGNWDLTEDTGRYTSLIQFDVDYALTLDVNCVQEPTPEPGG